MHIIMLLLSKTFRFQEEFFQPKKITKIYIKKYKTVIGPQIKITHTKPPAKIAGNNLDY